MAKKKQEIAEGDIRAVIWMLKAGKTKKACCEQLGIAYNTTRLMKIVNEFKEQGERTEELKKKARAKSLTDIDKRDIAKTYIDGEPISRIAERLYLTSPRIKKVLLELNVPLRGRGRKIAAKTEHVVQNLDKKFAIDDTVFYGEKNTMATIKQVFDEDYLEYLSEGYLKAINNPHVNLKSGQEPQEHIHYETYWVLEDGQMWRRAAAEDMIQQIEQMLEETGREYYRVWLNNDYGGFYTVKRADLFPVEYK